MTDGATEGTSTDVAWHALAPDETLRQQSVTPEAGLTSAEAQARPGDRLVNRTA